MKYIGVVFILIYAVFVIGTALRNILIGKGVIENPHHYTDEKLRQIYKKGIISLLFSLLGGGIIFLIIFNICG